MITISTRDYTTDTWLTEYLIARNVKNMQIVQRLVKPMRYVMI